MSRPGSMDWSNVYNPGRNAVNSGSAQQQSPRTASNEQSQGTFDATDWSVLHDHHPGLNHSHSHSHPHSHSHSHSAPLQPQTTGSGHINDPFAARQSPLSPPQAGSSGVSGPGSHGINTTAAATAATSTTKNTTTTGREKKVCITQL